MDYREISSLSSSVLSSNFFKISYIILSSFQEFVYSRNSLVYYPASFPGVNSYEFTLRISIFNNYFISRKNVRKRIHDL